MSNRKIKVMVVDDSPVARDLLTFIIESDPLLIVSGYAVDGLDALARLKQQNPDVITMDVIMPKMNGYEATKKIMETSPVPIIIVTASYHTDEVEKSFEAIQAGALAILAKPVGPGDPDYPSMSKEIQDTIKIVSELKLITRRNPFTFVSNKTRVLPPSVPNKKSAIRAVAIGASLGGPQAIAKILSELPASFPVPVYIVQHISTGFMDGLVSWLSSVTGLKVSIATDNQIAEPGRVYLAPESADMEISPGDVIHLRTNSSGVIRRSVGSLFASMAKTYGPHAVGVILTGMGKDGAAELLQMKNSGSFTIAQNKETCIVFGMPNEAILLGGVTSILPLAEIASALKHLTGTD